MNDFNKCIKWIFNALQSSIIAREGNGTDIKFYSQWFVNPTYACELHKNRAAFQLFRLQDEEMKQLFPLYGKAIGFSQVYALPVRFSALVQTR
jgi:hypothetical protein